MALDNDFNAAAAERLAVRDFLDAVIIEDFEKVEEFFRNGGDPNAEAPVGSIRGPALNAAIMCFSALKMINFLLENGADIEGRGDNDITPLMQASISGRSEVTALLLEKGAILDKKGSHGYTALDWAEGDDEIAGMLHRAADERARAEQQRLARAAQEKEIAVQHATAAGRQEILRAHAPKLVIKPAEGP